LDILTLKIKRAEIAQYGMLPLLLVVIKFDVFEYLLSHIVLPGSRAGEIKAAVFVRRTNAHTP
jgi:hypothetical protein